MKRMKDHRIKKEAAEASTSKLPEPQEHDLAYYIHDRVELMHQVFSLIKVKDLKAMAPECIRGLSRENLQELCTEELLGISSKRLLAILDDAEPPTDTESSSGSPAPCLETVSLDSISSDDDVLSVTSKKKKHKHSRRSSKSKSKKKDKGKGKGKKSKAPEDGSEQSKATRAGLTVLELLELQARARAIRAQLHNETTINASESVATASIHSSDSEVEIKEEAPDIVELSSEDEKPDLHRLRETMGKLPSPNQTQPKQTNTEIRRVNDLVITVPQSKQTRKIKLNRSKVTVTVPNVENKQPEKRIAQKVVIEQRARETRIGTSKETSTLTAANTSKELSTATPSKNSVDKTKSKKRKKDKKKRLDKDGIDHDEITLQLSDSEKMDLLEDLDESSKNYERLSSSTADSDSSSSDSGKDSNEQKKATESTKSKNDIDLSVKETGYDKESGRRSKQIMQINLVKDVETSGDVQVDTTVSEVEVDYANVSESVTEQEPVKAAEETISVHQSNTLASADVNNQNVKVLEINDGNINIDKKAIANIDKDVEDTIKNQSNISENDLAGDIHDQKKNSNKNDEEKQFGIEIEVSKDKPEISNSEPRSNVDIVLIDDNCTKLDEDKDEAQSSNEKSKSDGELSDRASSEIETVDVRSEVVCISDEEKQTSKKKKKKDKKAKKDKKSKKNKSDFRSNSDQNFYRENTSEKEVTDEKDTKSLPAEILEIDDDVYEILELSDDSSCYEVEGTVLSKEPTAEQIEALSAKIDELEDCERHEIITDKQLNQHELIPAEKEKEASDTEHPENVSWMDRYLGSRKVKRVLSTANILNAIRKKNKELKIKLNESKSKEPEVEVVANIIEEKEKKSDLEEGSIEQYNALQGSTKYVDPVREPSPEKKDDTNVTKEMKKDAKQLLKMYKKLLKYNDMSKTRDPNKKKKKKSKKKEKPNGDKSVTTVENEKSTDNV